MTIVCIILDLIGMNTTGALGVGARPNVVALSFVGIGLLKNDTLGLLGIGSDLGCLNPDFDVLAPLLSMIIIGIPW